MAFVYASVIINVKEDEYTTRPDSLDTGVLSCRVSQMRSFGVDSRDTGSVTTHDTQDAVKPLPQ